VGFIAIWVECAHHSLDHLEAAARPQKRILASNAPAFNWVVCVASFAEGYSPSYVRTAFVPAQRRSASAQPVRRTPQPAATIPALRSARLIVVCAVAACSVIASEDRLPLLCSLGNSSLPLWFVYYAKSNQINKALLLSSLDTAILRARTAVPLPSVAHPAQPFDPLSQQPNSQSLRSAPSDRWCAVALRAV
jgi:hypothetical protein